MKRTFLLLLCLVWCGATWAAAGDGDGQTIRYEYDDLDRLLYVQTLNGETEYAYDELGNRINKTFHSPLPILIEDVIGGYVTTSAAFRMNDSLNIDFENDVVMVLAEPAKGWKLESIKITYGPGIVSLEGINVDDAVRLQKALRKTPSWEKTVTIDITDERQFTLTNETRLTVKFVVDESMVFETIQTEDEKLCIAYNKADQSFHINGAPANVYCVLYTLDGRMVSRAKSRADGTACLRAMENAFFILQVGKSAKKVMSK